MIQTSSYQPTMARFGVGMSLLKAMSDGPAPAPTPDPTPAPVPDPTPDIDFSKIDTPEKAALTPALNPAVLVAAAATFAASLSSNGPVTSAVQLTMGQSTTGSINYSLFADQSTQSVGVKGEGTFGNLPFNETWTINTQQQDPSQPILMVMGSIGDNAECLAVTVDQKSQSIHVDGKVGDVEVHHTLAPKDGGKISRDSQPIIVVDGTLGGVADHMELSAVVDQSNPNQAQLNMVGTLGDKAINGNVTAQVANPNDPKSMSVTLGASGNIAGTDFTMTGTLAPAGKK